MNSIDLLLALIIFSLLIAYIINLTESYTTFIQETHVFISNYSTFTRTLLLRTQGDPEYWYTTNNSKAGPYREIGVLDEYKLEKFFAMTPNQTAKKLGLGDKDFLIGVATLQNGEINSYVNGYLIERNTSGNPRTLKYMIPSSYYNNITSIVFEVEE